jgi:hypothetical protein
MGSRKIETECQADIYLGETYHSVTFNRITIIEVDKNYGADADGNRGVYREFIGDDYAENIIVDGKPLCNEWSRDLRLEIEEELEAWLRDNEVEG